jgi:hypothetical protein
MSNITTTNIAPASLSTFLTRAKRHADANKGKLIFGFDATASRGPSWATAQELQANMFAAVKRLDVQLAVYRGTELLASPWESDPDALRTLMAGISVVGGNTQISRLLQHVIDENARTPTRPVNAFVFIGDTFEEQYTLAHIKAQCKALGDLKIPGFFFLEGTGDNFWTGSAKPLYEEFAKLTGGAFANFDANSAKFLADLLESVATFASGGLTALAARSSDAARLLLTQLKK